MVYALDLPVQVLFLWVFDSMCDRFLSARVHSGSGGCGGSGCSRVYLYSCITFASSSIAVMSKRFLVL